MLSPSCANIAFQDPIFKLRPNALSAGESLIWAPAKQTGRHHDLRYSGEEERYEKDWIGKSGLE